jgi:hypothetical protein
MDNCANNYILLGGESKFGKLVVAIVLDFKTITVAGQTQSSVESANQSCVGILLDILCGSVCPFKELVSPLPAKDNSLAKENVTISPCLPSHIGPKSAPQDLDRGEQDPMVAL